MPKLPLFFFDLIGSPFLVAKETLFGGVVSKKDILLFQIKKKLENFFDS